MVGKAAVGVVLMIHGAGGGGWEFDFWKPVWQEDGWCVEARDLMPAPGGLAATTLADYRRQIEAWGQGLTPGEPLVIVGASMGGPLALQAAKTLRADAVILVNPATPRPEQAQGIPDIIRWAGGPVEETIAAMPDSEAWVHEWAAARWRDESGAVLRELYLGPEVPRPEGALLTIIGAEDKDIPPVEMERLSLKLGGEHRTWPGVSHVGPLLGRRAGEIARFARDWTARRLGVRFSSSAHTRRAQVGQPGER